MEGSRAFFFFLEEILIYLCNIKVLGSVKVCEMIRV